MTNLNSLFSYILHYCCLCFITVHFRHKEVTLYPDDDKKPPVGFGLNRRAQVTLDRVWPMDKTTHTPITDAERLKQMDYEGKLRRVCAKLHTRFLEYRPLTGSWVFKVSIRDGSRGNGKAM